MKSLRVLGPCNLGNKSLKKMEEGCWPALGRWLLIENDLEGLPFSVVLDCSSFA